MKDKGGRPSTGRPTGRKVTIYMLPDVEAQARDLGNGNLSFGVRIAVAGWTGTLAEAQRSISQRAAEARKRKAKEKK